jgi:hypothetical protein
VLGLRTLGFDVTVLEETEGLRPDQVEYLRAVEEAFGIDVSVVSPDGWALVGPPIESLSDVAERSAFIVNISGNLTVDRLLSRYPRRVYVDVDPGYTQFWHASGRLGKSLAQHTDWFTVGSNIGTEASAVPTGGLRWHPIRPPVLLDAWPVASAKRPDRLTTVASWRGAFGPVEADGRRFGVKAHQWRRFLELPSLVPQSLEAALSIDPTDGRDREALTRHGWRLVDPIDAAGNPELFRSYIQRSGGEFSVAQDIYVATNSGWFSDRTAAYLASGKPVLVQDTGFGRSLPTGEGVVHFSDIRGAADGAHRIAADYEHHAQAAREIAVEYFAADVVLGAFLDELGVQRPARPR